MRYWLYDWLDEHGITDLTSADRALSSSICVAAMRDYAQRFAQIPQGLVDAPVSVLAGYGMDLSGIFDCPTPSCRIRNVDKLLARVWHYFDKVVINDTLTSFICCNSDPLQDNDQRRFVLGSIQVAVYLRHIGAEKLVDFRTKPPVCEQHPACMDDRKALALEVGLPDPESLIHTLAKTFRQQATIDVESRDTFVIRHPGMLGSRGSVPEEDLDRYSDQELLRQASESIVDELLSLLISDLAARNDLGIALGSTNWLYHKLLGPTSDDIPSVAFHLDLPVLQGVAVPELLRLRLSEGDAFERFRRRLAEAIKERVHVSRSAKPSELATEIRRDLIEPEVLRIRSRLDAARRSLSRKTSAGVVIGSLATTCGLLAGVPATAATLAGIGTSATAAIAAINRFVDTREDVSLSDMYFLWKAIDHFH